MTDLGRLLDRALGSYAGEPPAGLAERVLARTSRTSRGRWWPTWAGLAVAAMLAAVFVPRPFVPPPPPPLMISTPAVPALARPMLHPLKLPPLAAKPSRGTPLSAQERRWIQIARTHPELVAQMLTEASPLSTEPLVIAPLELSSVE